MKRRSIITFFVLLCAGLSYDPNSVAACSCATETAEEALGRSTAVFEGRVLAVEFESSQPNAVTTVELAIVRSWKGIDEATVAVRTAANEAACGYRFEKGKTYLVYATRLNDDELHVSLCSRTVPIELAEKDLGSLGDARPPASSGCKRCNSSLTRPLSPPAAGATALFLLFVLLRRRGTLT